MAITPVTTLALIREQQESTVRGLTPDSFSRETFTIERAEFDFREWAEANPVESFRKFSLRQVDGIEGPSVSDSQIEQRRSVMELVVAYPKTYGKYGAEGHQSLMDAIREDQHKIDTAVGLRGGANYAAGQNLSMDPEGGHVEDGEGVVFLVFNFEIDYFILLGTQVPGLKGVAAGVATVVADLTLLAGTLTLGGQADGVAGAVGAITLTELLQGQADAVATATGDAGLLLSLAGAAAGVGDTVGAVTLTEELVGAAAGVGTTVGDLTVDAAEITSVDLLTSMKDTANQTVYTTASITATANAMVVIDINARKWNDSGALPTSVVHSGSLGTFTLETSAEPLTANSFVGRYVAYEGGSPTAGTIAITYAFNRNWCTAVCYEVIGTDGVDGTGASDTDEVTSATSTTTSLTGPIDGNIVACAIDISSTDVTEDADFTLLAETTGDGALNSSYAIGNETGNTTTFSSDDAAQLSTALVAG